MFSSFSMDLLLSSKFFSIFEFVFNWVVVLSKYSFRERIFSSCFWQISIFSLSCFVRYSSICLTSSTYLFRSTILSSICPFEFWSSSWDFCSWPFSTWFSFLSSENSFSNSKFVRHTFCNTNFKDLISSSCFLLNFFAKISLVL